MSKPAAPFVPKLPGAMAAAIARADAAIASLIERYNRWLPNRIDPELRECLELVRRELVLLGDSSGRHQPDPAVSAAISAIADASQALAAAYANRLNSLEKAVA